MSIYVVEMKKGEKIVKEIISGRRVNDWEEAIVLCGNQKNEAQPTVVARE